MEKGLGATELSRIVLPALFQDQESEDTSMLLLDLDGAKEILAAFIKKAKAREGESGAQTQPKSKQQPAEARGKQGKTESNKSKGKTKTNEGSETKTNEGKEGETETNEGKEGETETNEGKKGETETNEGKKGETETNKGKNALGLLALANVPFNAAAEADDSASDNEANQASAGYVAPSLAPLSARNEVIATFEEQLEIDLGNLDDSQLEERLKTCKDSPHFSEFLKDILGNDDESIENYKFGDDDPMQEILCFESWLFLHHAILISKKIDLKTLQNVASEKPLQHDGTPEPADPTLKDHKDQTGSTPMDQEQPSNATQAITMDPQHQQHEQEQAGSTETTIPMDIEQEQPQQTSNTPTTAKAAESAEIITKAVQQEQQKQQIQHHQPTEATATVKAAPTATSSAAVDEKLGNLMMSMQNKSLMRNALQSSNSHDKKTDKVKEQSDSITKAMADEAQAHGCKLGRAPMLVDDDNEDEKVRGDVSKDNQKQPVEQQGDQPLQAEDADDDESEMTAGAMDDGDEE